MRPAIENVVSPVTQPLDQRGDDARSPNVPNRAKSSAWPVTTLSHFGSPSVFRAAATSGRLWSPQSPRYSISRSTPARITQPSYDGIDKNLIVPLLLC